MILPEVELAVLAVWVPFDDRPPRQPKTHIRQVECALREYNFGLLGRCVADRIRMVSHKQPDIFPSSRHRMTAAMDGLA